MTIPIFEFPREWYSFTRGIFALTSRSQVAARPWLGGKSVYGPHAQMWAVDLSLAPQDWDSTGQAMAAFFSRLGGQAGLIRIGHASRVTPQLNRLIDAGVESFSDDTLFDDGSGFVSGLVPPAGFVGVAASRGARSIVAGGLQASTSRVLRRGDLIEIRPGGIAAAFPHLYEVMVDGNTNAAGETGVEVRPPLRSGIAAGDQAVLDYASSVFRLVDDDQGVAEISGPATTSLGFKLIEAVDLVP